MKLEKYIKIDGIRYNNQHKRAFITMFGNFTQEEFEILQDIFHCNNQKLTLEVEEPILDEEERKYLSGVIRPFRDKVKCIKKRKDYYTGDEFISIITNKNATELPYFTIDTMYKNLELNKEYSLKDLDL